MRRALVFAVLFCGFLASAARAEYSSFESRWAEATRSAHKILERPDMKVVSTDEGRTYWYFSKPGHPAHPGILKLAETQDKDGKWVVAPIQAYTFESPVPQSVYQAWISEVLKLEREIRAQMQGQ